MVILVVAFDFSPAVVSSVISIVVPPVVLSSIPVIVPVALLCVPLLASVAMVTARVLPIFPILYLLAFPVDVFLRLGVGLFALLFVPVPLALVSVGFGFLSRSVVGLLLRVSLAVSPSVLLSPSVSKWLQQTQIDINSIFYVSTEIKVTKCEYRVYFMRQYQR